MQSEYTTIPHAPSSLPCLSGGKAELHPYHDIQEKEEAIKGTSFLPCPPPPKHLETKDKVKMSCSTLSNR